MIYPVVIMNAAYHDQQPIGDNASSAFKNTRTEHLKKELGTVIEDDDDTNVDSEKEFSLEQKLNLAIAKKILANQDKIQKQAISKTIQREIDLFEDEIFRNKYTWKKYIAYIANNTTN
ncbi:hypothetical protein TNCV_4256331 [Trichonephila clavipes]|nr:hypothetical protein TNCV_4256331 [Trichonephila clavipes]